MLPLCLLVNVLRRLAERVRNGCFKFHSLARHGMIETKHIGMQAKAVQRVGTIAILCIAAIITPADPFSMMIAAAPLLLLYEASVIFCKPRPADEDMEESEPETAQE